jgi:hypothetical protein
MKMETRKKRRKKYCEVDEKKEKMSVLRWCGHCLAVRNAKPVWFCKIVSTVQIYLLRVNMNLPERRAKRQRKERKRNEGNEGKARKE